MSLTNMLVHPSKSKIRSRPTRLYLARNSPVLAELKDIPHRPQERKRVPARSSLLRFKFSIVAVVVLIIFHWSYRPRRTNSQRDGRDFFSILSQVPPSTTNPSRTLLAFSNNAIPMTAGQVRHVQGHALRKFNWKRPLVDRATLEKVDGNFRRQQQMQVTVPAKDMAREPTWRPTIWEIPRKGHRPAVLSVPLEINDCDHDCNTHSPDVQNPAPSPTIYSPTERFLLPLRIAEQESRARMHLSQLIQLAKELNRTLVLPNVGKSRIGACYHWGFETYYDIESLAGHATVKPEEFKAWIARHPSAKSRTLSVRSQPLQDSQKGDPPSHEDIYFKAYQGRNDPETPPQLPTCLVKRFPHLRATHQSSRLLVNEDSDARADESRGDSFISLLKSVTVFPFESDDVFNGSDPVLAEPEVLILDWDIRHPIFDTAPALNYSPKLHDLARRLAPQDPYLAVHWRTETVPPNVLGECAYALIGVLDSILHDETTPKNISAIWLASDYPGSIKTKEGGAEHAPFSKSGTYKRLTPQLEGAIDVLRESFSESGLLHDWSLRDLFDVQRENIGDDEWLLNDIGGRGILDKLISIRAKIFFSGSRSCSRHSSYTGQIIEARAAKKGFEENIVEVFGI